MIFPVPIEQMLGYGLILIRVSGIFFALPFFGDASTPVKVRIMISLAFTFMLSATISDQWSLEVPDGILESGLLVARELTIGLVLGFLARLTFAGLTMAASLVGYQMGFGTADLLMPDANEQMSGFTVFHRIIVVVVFLALNLHHHFIQALFTCFDRIPVGGSVLPTDLSSIFIDASADVLTVALQLSSPIFVALMFAMGALGLIARTVPQMNVFTISFPLSFFMGMLVYLATLPLLPNWLDQHFGVLRETLDATIFGMATG